MATAHELIEEQFLQHRAQSSEVSDIYEHLDLIKSYAERSDSCIEFGVRSVVSTWALLAGKPRSILSVDIEQCPVERVSELAKDAGVDFNFVIADTLTIDVPEADLLLIDTFHTYSHLLLEMIRHGHKARKFMLLHDTARGWPKNGHPGMWESVERFLEVHSDWRLAEHVETCHGMTVLERVRAAHPSPLLGGAEEAELLEVVQSERELIRDTAGWLKYLDKLQIQYRSGESESRPGLFGFLKRYKRAE